MPDRKPIPTMSESKTLFGYAREVILTNSQAVKDMPITFPMTLAAMMESEIADVACEKSN
jgi:hypothetical protein